MFRMSFGLESMIMVALLVYALTGLVSIGMLVWTIKVFGPVYKVMIKQMNRMYAELEEDEQEVELQRIK
jgi:hypothetical protein